MIQTKKLPDTISRQWYNISNARTDGQYTTTVVVQLKLTILGVKGYRRQDYSSPFPHVNTSPLRLQRSDFSIDPASPPISYLHPPPQPPL